MLPSNVSKALRPDILDDGSLTEQPFKKIKAFTDVGNIEAMSKERWGAAKWVRGQPRMYCVNEFESKEAPANDLSVLQQRPLCSTATPEHGILHQA